MKTLDIKGEVCPYTFVKTKLALEHIKGSDTLKVITDHMPAVDNVSIFHFSKLINFVSGNKNIKIIHFL